MVTPCEFRSVRLTGFAVVLTGALVVLGATPAAHGSSKPPKSGKYVGKSSEGSAPVSFTVSANGKKITSFTAALGYNGHCGQGGGPNFTFKVPAMTITAGGQFSTTTVGKDNAAHGTIQITGSIAKQSAHGTIAEPKPFFACHAPNQKVNPYSETFTAATH
jgi:hypothetical protein